MDITSLAPFDIIFFGGIFIGCIAFGYLKGAQVLTELSLALLLAALLTTMIPLAVLPTIFTTITGSVPFFSAKAVLFVIFYAFAVWVTVKHHSQFDEIKHIHKIIYASITLTLLSIVFLPHFGVTSGFFSLSAPLSLLVATQAAFSYTILASMVTLSLARTI